MHDSRDTFMGDTVLAINCEHVSTVQTYYDRRAPVLHEFDTISAAVASERQQRAPVRRPPSHAAREHRETRRTSRRP